MMAGVIVSLPRAGELLCGGCRRLYPLGRMVALDLPRGGWVMACPFCYQADPCGAWRGLSCWWDGERWREEPEKRQWEMAFPALDTLGSEPHQNATAVAPNKPDGPGKLLPDPCSVNPSDLAP